jgi:hypothetical protein
MFTLLAKLSIADGSKTRTIGVYCGDLSEIPPEHAVDLLVLSAFPNAYQPTPTSLIGALSTKGISISDLAADKLVDLRKVCNFWLSKTKVPSLNARNIKQIACFESAFRGAPPQLVGNLFRGLFPFLSERENSIVAMPLLATGDQGYSPSMVFEETVSVARHWMARGLGIEELKIVIRDPAIAVACASSLRSKGIDPPEQIASPDAAHYDVFLSFSSKDQDAANIAKETLTSHRSALRIFDYRHQIDKGAAWQSEIDKAIRSCRKVIAILSPDYFSSPECQEELAQARLRHKHEVGPILLPMYWRSEPDNFALWLQTINFADCREQNSKQLVQQITALNLI